MTIEQTEMPQETVRDAVYRALRVQKNSIGALQNSETVNQIIQVAQVIDEECNQVIFTGIGKSGDIAKKISSTFKSVGMCSDFIHPVEALHGELGAVSKDDAIVLLSNSGETEEVLELLQFLSSFDVITVAITSDPRSQLGQQTDYRIDTKIETEGGVVDLVPMARLCLETRSLDRERAYLWLARTPKQAYPVEISRYRRQKAAANKAGRIQIRVFKQNLVRPSQ